LGTSWITLLAPVDRAIPENFLRGLINVKIEPIVQFQPPLDQKPDTRTLHLLFKNYAKWGVRYVVLFDRPNTRRVWGSPDWGQSDLTESFLDIYLPIAEIALQTGLTPVFPPLEPGGDYWDTAFLSAALKGISRRCTKNFINKLVLGAYAYVEDQPINWGAGGPDRWPLARPYHTSKDQQDQRGFYIFNWYLQIAEAILGDSVPIILFGAGKRRNIMDTSEDTYLLEVEHAKHNLMLAKLVCDHITAEPEVAEFEPIPSQVIACNFWLLTATRESPHVSNAWFQPDGNALTIVEVMYKWLTDQSVRNWEHSTQVPELASQTSSQHNGSAIEHYLLLPLYDWGVSEWYLDVVRPFILKHKPTVGFSPAEAARAQRVTVIGNEEVISEQIIEDLRRAGCRVNRISGDGTDIASVLASN